MVSRPGDLWVLGATVAWIAYSLLSRWWPSTLDGTTRLCGMCAGGRVMNHLPQHWLRAGVVGFGLVMSGYFFWRAYL